MPGGAVGRARALGRHGGGKRGRRGADGSGGADSGARNVEERANGGLSWPRGRGNHEAWLLNELQFRNLAGVLQSR